MSSSLKPLEQFLPDLTLAVGRKGIDSLFERFRTTEQDGRHIHIW